jgi:hypothetical protein
MRGRKRTRAQREDDLVRIADMHSLEMSQSEIAGALGYTQQQISHDLKEIYRRWSVPGKLNLEAIKARLLLEIKANKKAMRKAWERSQATKETTTQKQIKTPGGVVGAGEDARVEPDKERQEASLKAEGRDGSVCFMREVREYISLEIDIHGLRKKSVEVSGAEDGPPIKFIAICSPASRPATGPAAITTPSPAEPDTAPPPAIPKLT